MQIVKGSQDSCEPNYLWAKDFGSLRSGLQSSVINSFVRTKTVCKDIAVCTDIAVCINTRAGHSERKMGQRSPSLPSLHVCTHIYTYPFSPLDFPGAGQKVHHAVAE